MRAIGAAVVGVMWVTGASAQPGSGAATPVIAADVERAPTAAEVPLTGTVLARRVSQISAELAGYVASLAVDVGDEVAAGDAIAQLDATIALTNLQAAQATVAQSETALADAERRRDEARELLAKSNVAESQYESLVAEVDQAGAVLARNQAALALREALLSRHRIAAPFAGVVATRSTEAGEWLQPGATVVELQELDVVRVRVDVPQALYPRVAVGTNAEVTFDAYPNEPWRAAVSIRVPVASASSRAFPVLLELDNRDRRLTPGMSARVSLQVTGERRGETLAVPRDAVARGPDGVTRVWVIRGGNNGNRTVEPVAVRLGRSFDALVEIVGGDPLQAGEQVVIRGNETLRAGQSVRLVNTPSGSS
ncbi:MAG: efflux RND transporter periplasmic adaptor subunit [Pseudomonadota bacterium]